MTDRDAPVFPLGAPDHLYGDDAGPRRPRSPEERAQGRRAARRSLRVGGAMVVLGLVAMLFVPVRLVAVLGAVTAFFGALVVLVAALQAAVLRGPGGGDEEE